MFVIAKIKRKVLENNKAFKLAIVLNEPVRLCMFGLGD